MKNLLRLLILIFLAGNAGSSLAQNAALALGAWREHVPFNKAIDIAENNEGLIYCASSFGLFTYSKSSGELNALSRLREMSDQEISVIEFDKATGVLIVAYVNSNIDLIYPDKSVVNLPDIKSKNIVGGKNINSIIFINGFGYLACDFGIVVVDLNRREIKDTYYIAPNGVQLIIHDIAYNGTEMLAATDNGIYRAVFNDPNIFNYTAWSKDTNLTEPNGNYTSIASYTGKFYAVKTGVAWGEDTVIMNDNNQWTSMFYNGIEGAYINSDENFLYFSNYYRISAYDANGWEQKVIDITMYQNADIRQGYVDAQGDFWIADNTNGLVVRRSNGAIDKYHPNGPSSSAAWSIASRGGTLWVSTGVVTGDSPEYGAKYGVFRFSNNEWQSYDCTNDPIYQILCTSGSPAVNCVAIDPSDVNHAFVGSWGSGLLEFRQDGGKELYKMYNSSLHSLNADTNKINVGGVEYDSDGNLWALACGNTKPISVRKPNGAWQDFVVPQADVSGYSLYNLVVDDYGQKWFCAKNSSTGEGVCVFKERSLTDPNGASFRRLTDDVGNGLQ